jgi:hypothetical protein
MKASLVLAVLAAAPALGRVKIDGIFKENSFIAPRPRYEANSGIDCTPPTVEDCPANQEMHPWPCNCHKYWQCVNGEFNEHTCIPESLIFNPLTENCEDEATAPPGLCVDTPNPGSTTTSAPTTAKPTTQQPTTTTAEATTTQRPTTTTPKNCWICPGCTCDATVDIDGFFKPYPGNCHWYYQCVHNPNDPDCEWSSVGPYDCGDWAFNPEQASCTWPDLVDCNDY